MGRSLLPLVIALFSTATAMAMFAAAILLPTPPAEPPRTLATEATATRFYAAVNAAIATGDLAALRQVVSPGFADEAPFPGVSTGREGLESHLLALHHSTPGLQIQGDVMVATADHAVTRVHVQNRQSPLDDPPAVWGDVEVLAISGGAVVGRWSDTGRVTIRQTLAEAPLDLPAPLPRVTTLHRLTLAPGAWWEARDGPWLLIVEAGMVRVTTSVPTQGSRSRHEILATLGASESLAIPAATYIRLTNVGDQPNRLLLLAFAEPSIPNGNRPTANRPPPGVQVTTLAGGLAARVDAGRFTARVQRVTLGSEASLSLASEGGALLLAVETGQLNARTWGAGWVRDGQYGMNHEARADELPPGAGLLLQPGGLTLGTPAGGQPAQALLVTISGPAVSPTP